MPVATDILSCLTGGLATLAQPKTVEFSTEAEGERLDKAGSKPELVPCPTS